jgi:xanthosine utilization system XapX-like protein
MLNVPAGTWEGVILGLLLLWLVARPLASRIAARDRDPRIFRVIMGSAILKVIAGPLYIYVIDHFYNHTADAFSYNAAGMQISNQIRHLDFNFHGIGGIVGNGSTDITTGLVYAVIGRTEVGGFVFFAFLSFIGLVLFYRAFRTALPDADYFRYALLIFFLPSLVFWTAAIGKDSIVTFSLGLASLGAARAFLQRRGGLTLLALGITVTALIRPNLALIMFAGVAIGYVFRRAARPSPLNPVLKLLGILALIAGGLVLEKVARSFFGISNLSAASVEKVLKSNAANTSSNQIGQFRSSTTASVSLSPLAIPKDIYYVVIRPLPFQAHGVTQLASAIENSFLVALFVVCWRRVWAAIKAIPREPYVLMALSYSIVWIVLFASLGNLGILARERTSMLPLLLVLCSFYPARRRGETAAPAGDEHVDGDGAGDVEQSELRSGRLAGSRS